jgi:hypothetical protein
VILDPVNPENLVNKLSQALSTSRYPSGVGELLNRMLLNIRTGRQSNCLSSESPKNNPSYSWISKHIDFQQWIKSDSNTVLWLFAPSKCELIRACADMREIPPTEIFGVPFEHEQYLEFRIVITTPRIKTSGDSRIQTLEFAYTLFSQLIKSIPDQEKSQLIFTEFMRVLSTEFEKSTLIEMAQTLSTFTKEAEVERLLSTVILHDKITPGLIWKALKATLLSSATLLCRKVLILVATSFTSDTDYFLTEFRLLLEEVRGLLLLKCLFVCEVNHVLKETTTSVLCGEKYIEYDKERQGIDEIFYCKLFIIY